MKRLVTLLIMLAAQTLCGVHCGAWPAAPLGALAGGGGGSSLLIPLPGEGGVVPEVLFVGSTSNTSVEVRWNTKISAATGADFNNYTLGGGITLTRVSLLNEVVTITTDAQSAVSYTIAVQNITSFDGLAMAAPFSGTFTGTP